MTNSIITNPEGIRRLAQRIEQICQLSQNLARQNGSVISDGNIWQSLFKAPLSTIQLLTAGPVLATQWSFVGIKIMGVQIVVQGAASAYELAAAAIEKALAQLNTKTTIRGPNGIPEISSSPFDLSENYSHIAPGSFLYDLSQLLPILVGPTYEALVAVIIGWKLLKGNKIESSWTMGRIPDFILAQIKAEVLNRFPASAQTDFIQSRTLYEFAQNVAYLEGLNDLNQTNISVQVVDSDPPAISVILPATRGDNLPNNWTQNFTASLGVSSIVDNLDEILKSEIANLGISNLKDVPIMISGFSQGGLNAALFAQKFAIKYNIAQVITFGSPIGRFHFPDTTKVLAYEFKDDIVVSMDARTNASAVNTVSIPNGINSTPDGYFQEGLELAHNIYKYTDAVKDYGAQGTNNLDPFINDLPKTTKYYELYLDDVGPAEIIEPKLYHMVGTQPAAAV
jgi:hypothetical protein